MATKSEKPAKAAYPLYYSGSADKFGQISIRMQRDYTDLNGVFVERTHVSELSARLKSLRASAAARKELMVINFPEHSAVILKVQHSNMAPKDEPQSKWWYRDTQKGWDYLTPAGYQEYCRLEREHPVEVEAHKVQTKAALHACFQSQSAPIVDFMVGAKRKPASLGM